MHASCVCRVHADKMTDPCLQAVSQALMREMRALSQPLGGFDVPSSSTTIAGTYTDCVCWTQDVATSPVTDHEKVSTHLGQYITRRKELYHV
jgi:hypothetical protein